MPYVGDEISKQTNYERFLDYFAKMLTYTQCENIRQLLETGKLTANTC